MKESLYSFQNPQKFGRMIWNDIYRSSLQRTLKQDLKEIYRFYLDEETRRRLKKMNRLKRWIFLIFWLVKSMVYKLTPVRRILLLVAFVLFFSFRAMINTNGIQMNMNFVGISFFLLLAILMLELKDKLLATNELMAGRQVQFALLPDHHPTLSGWDIWFYTQPANEVGGDLVDYLKLDEDRLCVALGDVAGKGLGAALLMAKLQATLRALAPNYRSLSELGLQLNHILHRDGLPNRFASLIYLEITSNSGSVRVLNAGHLPPLLIKDDSIQNMPKGEPALGLQSIAKYKEQSIKLKKGESLVIYSDGITEARNEKGNFFGESQLIALLTNKYNLAAEEMGKSILMEVEKFIGEERPYDDLSLIVIKRQS